jgi:hypothetical protein
MELPHSFVDFHEVYRDLLVVPKIDGTNEDATRTWVWNRVRTILPLISLFHLRYVLRKAQPRILFIFRTGSNITSDIITLYEGALKNIYPELQIDENKGYTSNPRQNNRCLADGSTVSNRTISFAGSELFVYEVDATGYDLVFLDHTCVGVKVLGCKNVVQFAGLGYSV